ncbi:N-acetyltransferase [Acidobacterium sp. S8]|uniref:GNAT family N-acetyltransferase n=1 Tax=Acidobacterium sp. S8 TaxID=1641854 RepID=UPI00131B9CB7|nr:N-acetyltransferase [Acidobacterium sp. S8]
MIKLRTFQSTDLETLYRIDQVCFPLGIAYSKSELRYYLWHPKAFTAVAEGPEGIAGFCTGQSYLKDGTRAGHIITIDVLPEARRQGTGRLLFCAVEEHFRKEAVDSIHLEVATDNEAAQKFYSAMGYERIGRIPGYYNGKLDAVVMEKLFSGE